MAYNKTSHILNRLTGRNKAVKPKFETETRTPIGTDLYLPNNSGVKRSLQEKDLSFNCLELTGSGGSEINSDINFNGDIKVNDTTAVSGYFDDGVNFRITVVKGIITAIEDSSGAGHS